jgi:hypothetical protein
MKATVSVRVTTTAICFAVGAASFAAVKVEEQVLIPKTSNVAVAVSPTGVHTAVITGKGSRVVVIYDGTPSQPFDEILNPNGNGRFMLPSTGQVSLMVASQSPIVFSPDGARFAYAARDGDDYVVMVDGKELARARWDDNQRPTLHPFAFSPTGNHFYFGVTSGDTSDPKAGFRLQVDDKPGPISRTMTKVAARSNDAILFSPDGMRYAYVGTNTRDLPDGQWAVANGKQVKYFGDELQFTGSGRLLSVLTTPGIPGNPPTPGSQTLLIDAKPMVKAQYFGGVWVSPTSDRYAAVVTPKQGAPSFLTLDGKPVAGTEGVTIDAVYFSPDNKRFAVACTANGSSFMLLDGKRGPKYQSIEYQSPGPMFSPDSSKFIYVALSNGSRFLVVNEEEYEAGYAARWFLPTNGARLAFLLNAGQPPGGLYLDEKLVFKGPLDRFTFSPDGSRYAFVTGIGSEKTLHIDGTALSNLSVGEWRRITAQGTVDNYNCLFSPDGKHVAYLASDPQNEARRGLWIDQKLVFPSPNGSIQRPTFTPDSKHFLWVVRGPGTASDPQGRYQLYVDGVPSMTFAASSFENHPGGAWEVGTDGVLQFLSVEADGIKRHRVTPPPETSITTLLAGAPHKPAGITGSGSQGSNSTSAGAVVVTESLPTPAVANPSDASALANVKTATDAVLADPIGAVTQTATKKARFKIDGVAAKAKSWLNQGSNASTSAVAAVVPAIAAPTEINAIRTATAAVDTAVSDPVAAAEKAATKNAGAGTAEGAAEAWLDGFESEGTAAVSTAPVNAVVTQANTAVAQVTSAATQATTDATNLARKVEGAATDPAGTAVDAATQKAKEKTDVLAKKAKAWLDGLGTKKK